MPATCRARLLLGVSTIALIAGLTSSPLRAGEVDPGLVPLTGLDDPAGVLLHSAAPAAGGAIAANVTTGAGGTRYLSLGESYTNSGLIESANGDGLDGAGNNTLTNTGTGTITGGNRGVYLGGDLDQGIASLSNAGMIAGTNAGVQMVGANLGSAGTANGTLLLTNTGGTITGGNFGALLTSAASVSGDAAGNVSLINTGLIEGRYVNSTG